MPPLYISETRVGATEYRQVGIEAISEQLDGAELQPYAPISLQSDADQNYAVMMIGLKRASGEGATGIAVVVAFRDEQVDRVVFALQPWIRIVPAGGQPNG
jgi:hypothetical protein